VAFGTFHLFLQAKAYNHEAKNEPKYSISYPKREAYFFKVKYQGSLHFFRERSFKNTENF